MGYQQWNTSGSPRGTPSAEWSNKANAGVRGMGHAGIVFNALAKGLDDFSKERDKRYARERQEQQDKINSERWQKMFELKQREVKSMETSNDFKNRHAEALSKKLDSQTESHNITNKQMLEKLENKKKASNQQEKEQRTDSDIEKQLQNMKNKNSTNGSTPPQTPANSGDNTTPSQGSTIDEVKSEPTQDSQPSQQEDEKKKMGGSASSLIDEYKNLQKQDAPIKPLDEYIGGVGAIGSGIKNLVGKFIK